MKVFGIAGHSGMGKTTLLERLVPELVSRGVAVSVIKHSHKDVDVDRPGKDSYRLRESGCTDVLLVGRNRWALMRELRGAGEPSLDELLRHVRHCDLVLIEGFKQGRFPKLEVWRAAVGRSPLWRETAGIVAVAGDRACDVAGTRRPAEHLDLGDTVAIADCVLRHARRAVPAIGSFGTAAAECARAIAAAFRRLAGSRPVDGTRPSRAGTVTD